MIRRALVTLRQQPKAARDRVSFIIASVFTALVVGGWIFVSATGTSKDAPAQFIATPPPEVTNMLQEAVQESQTQFGAARAAVDQLSSLAATTSTTSPATNQSVTASTSQSGAPATNTPPIRIVTTPTATSTP